MGRAKTKAKQKSNVPILFPHDGPVYRMSRLDDGEDNESHGVTLDLAIKMLRVGNNDNGIDDKSEITFLVSKLFQVLRRFDTTTKEQLQALQTFKCSFLNLDKQITDGLKARHHEDWKKIAGLYRLLLEWSMSYHTPLPFQRAIQANLKILGSSKFSSTTSTRNLDDPETICKDVIESVWKAPKSWEYPLHSLDIAVNYIPLRQILQKNLMSQCLAFLGSSQTVSKVLSEKQGCNLSSQSIDDALQIVNMVKTILENEAVTTENQPSIILFENFVFSLLTNPKLPSDGFNTLGILYGKLLFLNTASESDTATKVESCITSVAGSELLSPLARLSMVQGIAATLDADILISAGEKSPLELCWEYSLCVGKTSTDPMVRWAAIKGLSTLASRWKQYQCKIRKSDDGNQQQPFEHMALVEKTLDLVFDSWENPPLRKLGMAIPGLFKALVQLLPRSNLNSLCQKVLEQPASRKGRYLALEILLPYLPLTRKQEDSTPSSSSTMTIPIESLLEGIGDRGSNAGSIANLWIKVLKCVWQELTVKDDSVKDFDNSCFLSWKNYWMPSFCQTILDPSLTRRKQVVAFCLPRIADLMKEFENLKGQLPTLFVGLLEGINMASEKLKNIDMIDCILWAQLEIIRFSSTMKVSDETLDKVIAVTLHRERFRFALVHSQPYIRIIAFSAMKCVISSYGSAKRLEEEAEMWRYALPYSIKTNESKEYLSNLLQCLSHFLDRLSAWEARITVGSESDIKLPIFRSFAVGFLIEDIFLDKGSYIGTIADKEIFGVSLLGCLLAFSLQDESYGGDKTIHRKNAIFNRKRSPIEEYSMNKILEALLRRDVLSSLFGLLHSIWDNTRSLTFQYLSKLVVASRSRKVALAKDYRDKNQRSNILARGIYLASSPRQRESDTGARMICFLYASILERSEKESYLYSIVEISRDRVLAMKTTLNNIMVGNSASTDGSCLPLAHGLVHSMRLCIDHDESTRRLLSITSTKTNATLNESMIEVFCKALQLSLSIVADVREGEAIDGIDEESLLVISNTKQSDSTPLNVNTGAIGANGTFSSVSSTDMKEEKARLAMQRVVVGSWLLTKETCAAIASVITTKGYVANSSVVSKVGQLLLSTLTTLKHAGAAFAARDALQKIAVHCLNPKNSADIYSLPDAWSNRLVEEISLTEKVRNSTLRRSTGYALGFLAIMRADIGNKFASSVVSAPLLQKLLKLSLPSEQKIKKSLAKLKIFENQSDNNNIFVYASESKTNIVYVDDSEYEARCRVHALNILRMIILDAPLASAISPLVGDTIISAILGYDDPSWAIRNSSTMVFAAAMLRVIDADKNASNSDKTSSNAITLTELFRRYPPLAIFIPSVLRICLIEMEEKGNVKSEMFPILLMLSRVQPIMDSTTKISDEFIPLLFRCLGSKDYGIRHAAARSLANLSPKNKMSVLLADCKQRINEILQSDSRDMNLLDGILLAMESLGLSSNKDLLDIEAQRTLVAIVNSNDIPPSCQSTALGILQSSIVVENDLVYSVCTMIAKKNNIQNKIGGSLLYKTAAEAMCTLSQESIWQATNKSTLEKGLSQLKYIFVDGNFDMRLYAIKKFKKEIYGNLDRLPPEISNTVTALSPTTILHGLATMLLDCVSAELNRGIANSMGTHIPTLRRLSRCLLETLDAIPINSMSQFNYALMWSISHKIMEREHFILVQGELNSVSNIESNGGNVLSSNAIEMMASALAMQHNDLIVNTNGRDTAQILDGMTLVLQVVNRLNDPNGSWRSRFSAAVALEKCCRILIIEEENASQENLRRQIMMTVLQMLQDSDPDVRMMAVQAATKCFAKQQEKNIISSAHIHLLPEWTLEQTFPLTFAVAFSSKHKKAQQFSIMKFLQAMILNNCQDLLNVMKNLKDEFSNTDQFFKENLVGIDNIAVAKLKTLVNVNTNRKIFEDEDPNPFQEKILLNQLAIQSLLNLTDDDNLESTSSSQFDSLLPSNTQDILSLCHSVLIQLIESQNHGGIVHDLTHYPTIFPSLHSILCASAAVLYLVAVAGRGLKTQDGPLLKLREELEISAKKLLLMNEEQQNLHPSILSALRALNQPLTKSDVERLLFLLIRTS